MTSETSSSEQQDPSTNPADSPDDVSSGANDFAAMLAKEVEGDEAGKTGDDKTGKPGETPDKVTPQDLAAIAERLGVKVEELYKVKVPASAGREAMTIGQIKDRFTEWDSLEADRLALSEERVQEAARVQAARDEFKELIAIIPKQHLNADALQAAARRLAQRGEQERAALIESIPEWKDDAKRNADVAGISESLKAYGLPASFVHSINSAGLLRFIRDAVRREAQVRKALEGVRKVQKKPTAQTQGTGAPRIGAQQGSRQTLKPVSERERFSAALHNSR
jgi:hypothetical protein